VLVVANKCDLAPPPAGMLGISAKTGKGVAELVWVIHRRLGVDVEAHRANSAKWWIEADRESLRRDGARAVASIAHRLKYR
jgi:hypothetical protein